MHTTNDLTQDQVHGMLSEGERRRAQRGGRSGEGGTQNDGLAPAGEMSLAPSATVLMTLARAPTQAGP